MEITNLRDCLSYSVGYLEGLAKMDPTLMIQLEPLIGTIKATLETKEE